MEDPLTDRIVVPAAFLLTSAVISVGCSPDLEPTSDRVEKPEEIVVYSTIRPANWDLYLFEQPGAAPKLLTTDPSPDYNPVFSPDGRWVVFTSDRHGTADLFALNLTDPGAPIRLTSGNAMEDAAAFSPDGQSLAFVSTESGNPDIFVMPFSPDDPEAATQATNITRDEAGDFNPAFSPDGEWIAFSSNRDSPDDLFWSPGAPDDYRAGDVYVMRADGTEVRRFTEDSGWEGSPAWATDGSLFFYSQREGDAADRDEISETIGSGGLITRIHRSSSDGTELQAVSASGESALSPAITPEGRVAFSAQRGEGWTIVSTEADWAPAYDPHSGRMIAFGPGETDSETRFETDAPGPFLANPPHSVELPDRTLRLHAVRGYLPTLDPAASEVATSEGFSRLVISRLDGTDKRVVFDSVREDRYRGDLGVFGPTWSDDGAWIAYGVGLPFSPVADVDIWKSRTDGSEAVNLTPDSDANDALPDFSPDGRRIVFRSTRDGNKEIYLMNADGTGLRRLTETEATNTMPSFSSAGDRVAFVSTRGDEQSGPRHAPEVLARRQVAAVRLPARGLERRGASTQGHLPAPAVWRGVCDAPGGWGSLPPDPEQMGGRTSRVGEGQGRIGNLQTV
jgi:Tol biopolymer transport system component